VQEEITISYPIGLCAMRFDSRTKLGVLLDSSRGNERPGGSRYVFPNTHLREYPLPLEFYHCFLMVFPNVFQRCSLLFS